MYTIEQQAKQEVAEEDHRESVDQAKVKLRKHKTLRERLFPWTITIKRINK